MPTLRYNSYDLIWLQLPAFDTIGRFNSKKNKWTFNSSYDFLFRWKRIAYFFCFKQYSGKLWIFKSKIANFLHIPKPFLFVIETNKRVFFIIHQKIQLVCLYTECLRKYYWSTHFGSILHENSLKKVLIWLILLHLKRKGFQRILILLWCFQNFLMHQKLTLRTLYKILLNLIEEYFFFFYRVLFFFSADEYRIISTFNFLLVHAVSSLF